MRSPFHIRPFQDDDLGESLILWRHLEPGITEADFKLRLHGSQVLVVVDEGANRIGIARLSRRLTMPSDQYFVWLAIVPELRRQGIGIQLFQRAEQVAQSEGVIHLISRIPDDDAAAVGFARKLGFKITRHMVNAVLRLQNFNATRLTDQQPTFEQQSIRFITYAEAGDTLANQQRLYQLNRTLSAQIPITEREDFPPLEAYVATRLQPATHPHEAIFIALNGDQWVGISSISIHAEAGYAFNEMTGVLPDFTGQGIAQQLKRLATRFAQSQGVDEVRTINDVGNAPMLAVNERLGYQRKDGFYFLKRSTPHSE